ncbi:GNAT domain-containing protein [Hypoxylon sp. FL0543]|nr:GNAT domain-containing protein [Hypoxylon sp. FL0543]
MKLNENIAISTGKVLLVPYDAHHVPRYHQWMEDAAIREATASERLTLDEEYENQISWREACDKLTFIICEPLPLRPALGDPGLLDGNDEEKQREQKEQHSVDRKLEVPGVLAGRDDGGERMVGDVNLFLTPWEDAGENEGDVNGESICADGNQEQRKAYYCAAEIDIMIAEHRHRGKGLGRATVAAFLRFVRRHLDGILAEYASADAGGGGDESGGRGRPVLRELVAKINASNAGSIALFKSLGFRQRGTVNYFGEIQMVLETFGSGDDGEAVRENAWTGGVEGDGYREMVYDRSRLAK